MSFFPKEDGEKLYEACGDGRIDLVGNFLEGYPNIDWQDKVGCFDGVDLCGFFFCKLSFLL